MARYDGGNVTLAEVQERIGTATQRRSAAKSRVDEEPIAIQRGRLAVRIVAERAWFESMSAERLAAEDALQRRLESLDRSLLLGFLHSNGLGISSLVSDKEARERYASLQGHLDLPATSTLRHVYLRVDDDSPAEMWAAAKAEAERVRRLLLEPKADLDAIIAANSDSEDAISGGWIRRFDPKTPNVSRSFAAAVQRLVPGEVSMPIETRRGYQVLLLVNRNASRSLSFEEIRDQLVGQIVEERREKRLAEIVAGEQSANPLVFDLEAFKADDPGGVVLRGPASQLTLAELRAAEPQLAAAIAEGASQGSESVALAIQTLQRNQYLLAFARHQGLDQQTEYLALRDRQRREAIIDFVSAGLVRERLAAIPAADLQRFYEDNKTRFATSRRLQLRGLLLTHASPDLYATFARAEALKRRLEGGEPFERVASGAADAEGAERGGDLGWLTHEDLAARGRLFHDTVVAAKTGSWLGPIKWERGYGVVRVEAIEEPVVRPYEEVKAQVRRAFHRRQLDPVREALATEVFASRRGQLNPALAEAPEEKAPR